MSRLKPALWSALDSVRPRATLLQLYVLATAIVAVAAGICLLLMAIVPQAPSAFFLYAGIVIVAWFLGAGPGWLSVILSTAVARFILFRENPLAFTTRDIPGIVAFGVCAAAANAFSLRQRAIDRTNRAARAELEQHVEQRTRSLREASERLEIQHAERLRAEVALREARNELARASEIASAGELAATIAHELNQPLAAIMGNCEAAANWLDRKPPLLSQAQVSVAAAVEAGDRAVSILKRIRSLVERGRAELRDTDVNDVIRSVMLIIGTDLTRRGITADCHYAPDLPLILGDRIQLQQLMLNLINNAVEAMDDAGIDRRRIEIRTSRNGPDYIRVEIEDSGKGLHEADLRRLFQPFYSTKEQGMGIGLSICRTIVESHGGAIRAASATGGGARFEVDLPVRTETEGGKA